MSASHLIHHAAGSPSHKYSEEAHEGVCATCAAPITRGVDTNQVNNPTFSSHAEFFKFGSHVCSACAWMYGDPKRTHRNVLCVGEELWWPMISAESATEERPSWMELFEQVKDYPPDTPLTGVLTIDPKPRLWPRCRMTTVGSRSDENKTRRAYLKAKGPLFKVHSRNVWQCYPLAWFSDKDVWAYLLSREVPYNRAYDRLSELGVPLRERRIGPLAVEGPIRRGALAILKQGWPDLFNRFAARHPEARRYV